MEQKENKMCMSIEQMSAELGISLTNCYRLAREKTFYPCKKIFGRYVVDVSLLREWLREQGK